MWRTRIDPDFRPRIIATGRPAKPTLSANEPAIIGADLQSAGMNQDYLRLKFGLQLAAKDPSICRPISYDRFNEKLPSS